MATIFINTDGGSRGNPGPAAIGVVAQDAAGAQLYTASQYIGVGTNNEAEYQAVLVSLKWLIDYLSSAPVEQVVWRLDSKLVVEQLNKKWKIKEPRMRQFAEQAWQLLAQIKVKTTFMHIPREKNAEADALVNQALDAMPA